MERSENLAEAIGTLQQLGLKEYEARCFVGLTRLETGTAKKLSELTEVPRTRVYDAIRVLDAQGLVEIQHTSPQQFRAVPIEEATATLQDQHEDRIERLENALSTVDGVDAETDQPVQQVWTLTGQDAIENRANELVERASEEVVLVLGEAALLTDELVETLNGVGSGVDLVVGALEDSLQEHIHERVPDATTFLSGLEWLKGEGTHEDDAAIGRLLMVDRSTLLVSSLTPDTMEERAVFGEGFGNGLVVVARRLMSQGLVTARDPRA